MRMIVSHDRMTDDDDDDDDSYASIESCRLEIMFGGSVELSNARKLATKPLSWDSAQRVISFLILHKIQKSNVRFGL